MFYTYKYMKQPKKRGDVSIYCNDKWHFLNVRINNKKQIKITDSELIEEIILKNILTENTRHKILQKIHLPGKFGYKTIEEKVAKEVADIGFFICPMTMHEIMSISNRKATVPQKSTFFDPKLIDGLVNLQMKL